MSFHCFFLVCLDFFDVVSGLSPEDNQKLCASNAIREDCTVKGNEFWRGTSQFPRNDRTFGINSIVKALTNF